MELISCDTVPATGPVVPAGTALPLNRRPVAAATERTRVALADLVAQRAPTTTRTAA